MRQVPSHQPRTGRWARSWTGGRIEVGQDTLKSRGYGRINIEIARRTNEPFH